MLPRDVFSSDSATPAQYSSTCPRAAQAGKSVCARKEEQEFGGRVRRDGVVGREERWEVSKGKDEGEESEARCCETGSSIAERLTRRKDCRDCVVKQRVGERVGCGGCVGGAIAV